MKIKKATFSVQEKKDVQIDLKFSFTNTWTHDVEWTRASVVLTNGEGRFMGGESTITSEDLVEQGEKGEVEAYTWLYNLAAPFQAGAARATIRAKFFRKVTLRLGEFDLADENGVQLVGETRSLEELTFPGATLCRWVEDGAPHLRIDTTIVNSGDTVFEQCILRANLVSPDGSLLSDALCEEICLPHAARHFQTEFYDLKKGKLKGARVQLWLDAHIAIGHETADADLKRSSDDDDDDDDDDE